MADLSSFTHKWRANAVVAPPTETGKISKRNRNPVSCQGCRLRKLKCDRGHPCDACIKRGEGGACSYNKAGAAPASAVRTGQSTGRDPGTTSSARAQDRLKRLEDLVQTIVDSQAETQSSDTTGSQSTPDSLTSVSAKSANASIPDGNYPGATDWSHILQHISELKNDIMDDYNDTEKPLSSAGSDALFGCARPVSLDFVLKQYLPLRVQVDRMVNQYFNTQFLILPFVHSRQFRRQYERFWQHPLETSPTWVSLLFSILHLGSTFGRLTSRTSITPHTQMEDNESFLKGSSQCLVLGNYTKPQPHILEALILYTQARYMTALDPQKDVAVVFALQVRLAYLMGYHRDGSNFPGLSGFESEMRRRVWATMKQFDLLTNFQLGIPNNVTPGTFDTKVPTNLKDSDFDEDTQVLPPARPETESTVTLYFVVKSRIADVCTKIYHLALSVGAQIPSQNEIMELDRQLRDQVRAIPEPLRAQSISDSVTEPGQVVMARMQISFLWRKALCVLHRKYMAEPGHIYSFRLCVENSSAICGTVIDLFPEFQAGGRWEYDTWLFNSVAVIDFLLASMLLCLAMSVSRQKYIAHGSSIATWLQNESIQRILHMIEQCQAISMELGQRSREAARVTNALARFLAQLRSPHPGIRDSESASIENGLQPLSGQMAAPRARHTPSDSSQQHSSPNHTLYCQFEVGNIETTVLPPAHVYASSLSDATDPLQAIVSSKPSVSVSTNTALFGSSDTQMIETDQSIDWSYFDQFTGFWGEDLDTNAEVGVSTLHESAGTFQFGVATRATNDDWNSLHYTAFPNGNP